MNVRRVVTGHTADSKAEHVKHAGGRPLDGMARRLAAGAFQPPLMSNVRCR